MIQRTEVTAEEFVRMLNVGEGTFSDAVFSFPVVLTGEYDFPLNFTGSVFEDRFSCEGASFKEQVHFERTQFRADTDFSQATFFKRTHFNKASFSGSNLFRLTTFVKLAEFFGVYFTGDVFFERTVFMKESIFAKAHFLRDVYFHKTYFGMRADFSYVAFADLYVTSFFSIKGSYDRMGDTPEAELVPPRILFRYVFFPKKTMFTNVDLSRTIFHNSMIEQIIFKDCEFSKKDGRSCFYNEVAQEVEFSLKPERFTAIAEGGVRHDFRINNGLRRKLDLGDVIYFVDQEDSSRRFKTYITERHSAADWNELFEVMQITNPEQDYTGEQVFLKNHYNQQEVDERGVVAFVFKPFRDDKHWDNVEDVNRQMKKSLEDSKDWQKAGEFYRGEMEAMIEGMRQAKQKPFYRNALALYGVISGFCESISRIVLFMLISLAVSVILLHQFKPDLSFMQTLEYTFSFFVPLLGKGAISYRSLDLLPWQNMIIMVEIVWYYLLWFFLLLTLQRKFRR